MFSCDQPYCTKSFTRKYELSRHQLRHSGQRAYACSFTGCKRAGTNGFTRKDHLRQHLRQVHGI
ncbi:hypothetical protein B0J14DRAFT_592109 [Halenospora varia]|nr:hypothetical protein B0J14DRAFT_592109 [Halenospora varia]